MGISSGVYQKYEMDLRGPGADVMGAFVRAGINSNWLLTGEGEMLLISTQGHVESEVYDEDNPSIAEHSDQAHNDRMSISTATLNDFALVPVYDVQASAGHGSLVESEPKVGHLAFRKDWIRDKGLEIKNLAIITAKGDSMEPTISDGDILLIDTSVDKIIDDTLYIVQADNHLIVKRIQQTLDGTLIIISDNKKYREQTIGPEQAKEVKIAGRVRWYGHEI